MALDETARGLGGFLYRRLQTLRFFLGFVGFVFFFLTKGREVRRRYAAAERSGDTIWLDHGPFRRGAGRDAG
jgi:hypothetical protein